MPEKENNFKTSFIPTKPVQAAAKGGNLRGNKGVNLANAVSLIIFFVTLIVAGGVYAYNFTLQKKIESQNQQLADVQKLFNPDFINAATLLNNRIESVKTLLSNHTSPSQIFDLLEETTLPSVQLTSFSYKTAEDGQISISGNGVAADFDSIVVQSDKYGATGYLRDILFSNLQPSAEGSNFNLSGTVDPDFVLYRNSLLQDANDNENNN
jgi:hypothetical protein